MFFLGTGHIYPFTPSKGCGAMSRPLFRLTGEDVPCRPAWMPVGSQVRINENLKKCVLFLGILDDAGEFAPYGTGFVLGYRMGEDSFATYLVTVKHVLDDMLATKRPTVARLNLKGGGSQTGNISEEWAFHPTDPKCDVAVTGFRASPDTFDYSYLKPGFILTKEYLQANDIGAGDQVFTVGLLVNHFGRERNIPIVRIGNIAAMPDERVDLGDRYGHQEVYLVESRSIGGLSGSPVFLQTPPFRIVRGEINVTADGNHLTEYLMGIHLGLFETKASGDTINADTAARRENFLEAMSAGIGIVVPIQRVLEILETPEFISGRERAMNRRTEKSGFIPTSAKRADVDVDASPPANDENPKHREDFRRLLGAAARKPAQED
jgi:hypothetical protein